MNDNATPRYYDGSVGGWHPIANTTTNGTAQGRIDEGHKRGELDAKTIIDNLARDKNGNIVETIKIITHSMGGAYGKGFVKALKEYIATLPAEQQKQIKISLVADFDPYEGSDITADDDIKTMQFIHYGLLANQKQKGKNVEFPETKSDDKKAHAIASFFADIGQLQEGTYKWNEQAGKFEIQKNN